MKVSTGSATPYPLSILPTRAAACASPAGSPKISSSRTGHGWLSAICAPRLLAATHGVLQDIVIAGENRHSCAVLGWLNPVMARKHATNADGNLNCDPGVIAVSPAVSPALQCRCRKQRAHLRLDAARGATFAGGRRDHRQGLRQSTRRPDQSGGADGTYLFVRAVRPGGRHLGDGERSQLRRYRNGSG